MSKVPIRSPRRLTLLSGLAVGVLALTLTAGCGKSGGAAADPKASQGLSGVDGTPTTGATGDSTGNPGTTQSSKPPTSTKPSAPRSSAAKGPVIATFKVLDVSCGGAGPGVSIPSSIHLQWSVTGATTVAISIDDVNFPKNNNGTGSWRSGYPPVYTTPDNDLSFACSDPKGNKTHTYTLSAVGNGVLVTKTVSATAYWEGT